MNESHTTGEWRGEAHRVLPRYFQRGLRAEAATRIGSPSSIDTPIVTSTTPVDGNPMDLRGIPAIGRGVGGAIAGTDPFRAAAARAREREARG